MSLYWTLISVLFVLAVVSFYIIRYYNELKAEKNRLDKIRNKWGRPVNARRNFKLIAAYLNATDNPGRILQPIADDLDLNNVFNFIDRTNSKPGKQYLYKKLFTPLFSFNELTALDKKIDALNLPRPDQERIELELSKLNSADAYFIAELFLNKHEPKLQPLLRFYTLFSGIAIIGLTVSLFFIDGPVYFILLIVLILINVSIHYATKNKISSYTRSFPQLLILNRVARSLLKLVSSENNEEVKKSLNKISGLGRSLYLSGFESTFANDTQNFRYALFKIIKLLFLLEPFVYITSIKRIIKFKNDIELIYNYVAEIDTLTAINSIRAGLAFYSKPIFYTEKMQMDLTDIFHPLIYNCVPNSIYTRADEGVLITGSNMSGKTTFIRSIAINMLLAQTIYTTCTREYKAPILKLQSSIRTSDDLLGQKSYFQAEALSILDIINKSESNEPIKSLIIIDEIFKGTNTIERIAAAKSVLNHLTQNKNFVFVSTHDLELAELLDQEYAVYSFEEVVDDTRLVFDYKMKTGLLKNKNGIAILKTIGYPETVVDDANIVSEELKRKYQM